MRKINWSSIAILCGAALSLVINLMMSGSLPDRIALQVTSGGGLANYVPKTAFLFVCPAFLVLDYIYSRGAEKGKEIKPMVVGVIIFAANLAAVFMNI